MNGYFGIFISCIPLIIEVFIAILLAICIVSGWIQLLKLIEELGYKVYLRRHPNDKGH